MSWMCKDDRDWSSPISIKGKSSWEDNYGSNNKDAAGKAKETSCSKKKQDRKVTDKNKKTV